MFRRTSNILYQQDMHKIDKTRLLALIEQSFGQRLKNKNLLHNKRIKHLYIEENYQGAMLLEEQELGLYLSKFAVDIRARGLGIATELWQRVEQAHRAFFWRCRNTNPLIEWYHTVCHGYQKMSDWSIFWRGFAPGAIAELLQFCAALEDDFSDTPP